MAKYGLIGYPLKHSFSKDFFNNMFASESIDSRYVNFEIEDVNDLKYIFMANPDLQGLNVTLPHKVSVMPLLDEIDKEAALIGAVNVIVFKKGRFGKIKHKGYNSDIIGFRKSIEPTLKAHHRKALILGTGGSSKAVFHGLKQLGVASTFVSRRAEKNSIRYEDISETIMEQYKIIVNTTPVGMYPKVNESPDIPYHLLTPDHLLYDLLYNPDETLFMKKGKEQGAMVKNGLEMLLLQAYASLELWNKHE
jgi:shikimate dehydrogenase